jgi:RNA recognition motif-containing protein
MVQARSFSDAAPADERKLYVGNLSFRAASEDLENHFAQFGAIEEAFIVMDREVYLHSRVT